MNIVPPKFKSKLDPYQFMAATCGNGPKRCNAGAGSGKTTTYAHRVAFLVANGVAEENIMATTFTKKAAKEMEERILRVGTENNLEINTSKMWIGTFHSLGIKVCREYSHIIGYKNNFTFDNDDQQIYNYNIAVGLWRRCEGAHPCCTRQTLQCAGVTQPSHAYYYLH